MMSLLRRLPYVKRLIERLIAIETRIAALETRIAAQDERTASTAQKLDFLVARMQPVEIQLEELSRNYTELTSGGLREILEHWEQRVRDDFALDRTHATQELRSEIALLRTCIERMPSRSPESLDDGVEGMRGAS